MSDTTLPPVEFTTGQAPLPDLGELSYNGVIFSMLYSTSVAWEPEQDEAARTVKWIKGTIEVEGIVTLPKGKGASTDPVMITLRKLLNQDGGTLRYTGRGFGSLIVNKDKLRDLNWGPKPETLSFQPLGGGRSAMVRWRVTTWVPEIESGGANVLQFNEETAVTFDEECYSGLSIRGTLEIGMTRTTQPDRGLTQTVDDYRQRWLTQIGNAIDLTRFRVTRRHFGVSRDKRVLEWEFAAEELPPSVLPFAATNARGSFRWQPMKKGLGLVHWLCSLRVTYTIDKRWPRRTAWFHFATLLWHRMLYARLDLPGIDNNAAGPQDPVNPGTLAVLELQIPAVTPDNATQNMRAILQTLRGISQGFRTNAKPLLISISGEEGLYLDGKSATFEAQWRVITPLANILIASGMWRYVGMKAQTNDPTYRVNNNAWALSMRDVQGPVSWLANRLNASGDVIVDFGTDAPLG